MRQIHIINPAAGNRKAENLLPAHAVETYRSTGIGDIERFVYENATAAPDTHFIAYGGDGTLNEVINGILLAGAEKQAVVSCIPTGTGNDFVRNFEGQTEPVKIDIIRYNDRYAINMLNIGFDCNVVARTAKLKKLPLVKGSFAYILGVLATLCRSIGHHFSLELHTEDNREIHIERELLLVAVGNGSYCGGGFYAMPLAKPDDGLFDVLTIHKISRRKFLALVGDYKAGTYLDRKTGEILPKFRDILESYRVKKMVIHHMETLCADGEVSPCTDAIITILPQCITYLPNPRFEAETSAEKSVPELSLS